MLKDILRLYPMNNDMNENIDNNLKNKMEELFNSTPDNTAVNDKDNELRFAKLNMPASVIDYLMDHYGLFDLVEVNMLSLYILKTLGHMEDDGFKFAIYKKTETGHESYSLDIHELIAKFRIGLAGAINENKSFEPDIKVEVKESNEKNNV
jgi:hypothetical protein